MLMAVVQMVWLISVTIFTIWFNTAGVPLRPWLNWDFVHSDFWRADPYENAYMPQFVLNAQYALWLMVPASTFIFVAFFAFGNEAVAEYKACFAWFKKHVLKLNVDSDSKKSYSSSPISR
jgi:pheromone a factor receptor